MQLGGAWLSPKLMFQALFTLQWSPYPYIGRSGWEVRCGGGEGEREEGRGRTVVGM